MLGASMVPPLVSWTVPGVAALSLPVSANNWPLITHEASGTTVRSTSVELRSVTLPTIWLKPLTVTAAVPVVSTSRLLRT